MSDDVRSDDPRPAGPIGAAMADLVAGPPPAGFTAWSVIGEVRRRRSVRRQVAGGLAAGVAALGVMVTIGVAAIGGGGSNTATSGATSASRSVAAAGTVSSAALPAPSSSGAAAESAAGGSPSRTGGDLSSTPSASVAATLPSGSDAASSPTRPSGPQPDTAGSVGGSTAGCAALPFTPEQLALIADRLPGLTPQASCALDDVELAVQDYTVDAAPGATLRVELRAGTYDPCAQDQGSVCVDDGSGVFSTTRVRGSDRDTLVWISGRAGSTVLTLTVPAGTAVPLTVAELTTAVTALTGSR